MLFPLVVTTALLLATTTSGAMAQDSPQTARGAALARQMCAECHAVEAVGDSRHPHAPPFRRLRRVLDIESFVDRLREGILVGHPDMPTFRMTRRDAAALAEYLMSLKSN